VRRLALAGFAHAQLLLIREDSRWSIWFHLGVPGGK
jgi:hypothetical protein